MERQNVLPRKDTDRGSASTTLHDDGDREAHIERRLILKRPLSPLDAAKHGRHRTVITILEDHLYPLLRQVGPADVNAMRLLLEKGAEVDRADEDGKTLYIACKNGHVGYAARCC